MAHDRFMRFFYVQRSAFCYVGLGRQSQDWPVLWFRYANLFSPAPMISVVMPG